MNNCIENKNIIDNTTSSLTTEWLSTEEAAEYLRISVKSLRNLTNNGKIPHYKLFKLNRYNKSELKKLITSNKRGVLNGI